ncbi:hypothetical protein I4F81_007194 [Pyropia yezoensis]|uniref:Uncharacterized protein n=1 Tax=Pyropia yezoensis TaxID=2788 RepID=A0ACC3C2U6_PYRYE|nr:hypothetical protein I4F81_007194 [Neopyropia yezoensis]
MTPAAGRVQQASPSGADGSGTAGAQGRALRVAAAIAATLTQPPKQGLFQSPLVVDAIHAGAALHCWPVVQDGLAEAERVLVPGGRMVATTFLNRGGTSPRGRWPPSWLPAGSALYRFFGPDELERLFVAAGFVNVTVEVLGWYAIVRAIKPE